MDVVTGAAIVIYVISTAWSQWRTGSEKIQQGVLQSYKERAELQEKTIIDHSKKIAVMESQIVEKNKQLDLLTKIAENRNPELERSIKTITYVAQESQKQAETIEKTLTNMGELMDRVNTNTTILLQVITKKFNLEIEPHISNISEAGKKA